MSAMPRRAVDAEADEALAGLLGAAGVDAHPDADDGVVRPRLGGQRPLGRHGGVHGIGRFAENDEEGVTLRALLGAAAAARRTQDRALASSNSA